MALGDLPGARARYESSLKIREHLVELSPGDAEAQANLNVILRRLGDVLLAAGDLSGARARYEMSLEIAERLVQANPSNTEAQRDLIASHDELGRLPEGKEHLSEALRIALDLQKTGRLPPSDSWMIDDLRKRIAAAEEAEP
jgi:tetratricopeptide (TPR) repeat protein